MVHLSHPYMTNMNKSWLHRLIGPKAEKNLISPIVVFTYRLGLNVYLCFKLPDYLIGSNWRMRFNIRTIWVQRLLFFLIKHACLVPLWWLDDSIYILLESGFWGDPQITQLSPPSAGKRPVGSRSSRCILERFVHAEQVHLLGILRRKDQWRASDRPLSSSVPKDRLRKPSCTLQSPKEHRILCLHCVRDHHYDLCTTYKVSGYWLTTRLTNSLCTTLSIVIIKLKVKKLLTRNQHPVI